MLKQIFNQPVIKGFNTQSSFLMMKMMDQSFTIQNKLIFMISPTVWFFRSIRTMPSCGIMLAMPLRTKTIMRRHCSIFSRPLASSQVRNVSCQYEEDHCYCLQNMFFEILWDLSYSCSGFTWIQCQLLLLSVDHFSSFFFFKKLCKKVFVSANRNTI